MLALSSHCFHEGGKPVNVPLDGSKPTWWSCVTFVGPDIVIAESVESSEVRFLSLPPNIDRNLDIFSTNMKTRD